jgi:hypothetical protein
MSYRLLVRNRKLAEANERPNPSATLIVVLRARHPHPRVTLVAEKIATSAPLALSKRERSIQSVSVERRKHPSPGENPEVQSQQVLGLG